jgi:uncharacterized protein (TIGR02145 family)
MKTKCSSLAVAFATISIAFSAPLSSANLEYGGKTYKTVKIGTQTWMAENLNYETKSSKCYQNNPDNCVKYGHLYDWETAMKICPKGWRLPNNTDWDKLFRFVDGDIGSKKPYDSPTAGKHLKAASGWNNNGNGTDDYGFSALPGGWGNSGGDFDLAGYNGRWWSANIGNSGNAYYRIMSYSNERTYWYSIFKSFLFSVRCLQD